MHRVLLLVVGRAGLLRLGCWGGRAADLPPARSWPWPAEHEHPAPRSPCTRRVIAAAQVLAAAVPAAGGQRGAGWRRAAAGAVLATRGRGLQYRPARNGDPGRGRRLCGAAGRGLRLRSALLSTPLRYLRHRVGPLPPPAGVHGRLCGSVRGQPGKLGHPQGARCAARVRAEQEKGGGSSGARGKAHG